MKKIAMSIITVALLLANSAASALVINTFDNGWYRNTGLHVAANTSIYTGALFGGGESRNFQAFNLASASGSTISAATLTYFVDNGEILTGEGEESIKISAVTSDIDDLLNGAGGVGAFNDLGTGMIFGSATVTAVSGSSMPAVAITLNALGLAALNAAVLNVDQRVVLGGALTTINGPGDALWSASNSIPSSMLDLTLVAIPVSSSLALLALGLVGIGVRRKKQ